MKRANAGRCRHENVAWCGKDGVLTRECLDCGEYIPIGPANDSADALDELTALEVAEGEVVGISQTSGVFYLGLNGADFYYDPPNSFCVATRAYWRRQYQSGALAGHLIEIGGQG